MIAFYLQHLSDTSTGEDDNFTGFKSGSSSTDKAEDDEQPKFYPRISQTHSNRIFVTSGVGEDKGGSKHDGRSHYSSENSGNQENNEDFGSSMDLSKGLSLHFMFQRVLTMIAVVASD